MLWPLKTCYGPSKYAVVPNKNCFSEGGSSYEGSQMSSFSHLQSTHYSYLYNYHQISTIPDTLEFWYI